MSKTKIIHGVKVKKVYDVVFMQCKERFRFAEHLVVASLVQQNNYCAFKAQFLQQLLDETVQFIQMQRKAKN